MKTLVQRLRVSKNGKEFMNTREKIARISYISMMFLYGIFWYIKSYDVVPIFSFISNLILVPILTFGLFMRNYYYFYVYNWFFLLFNIITISLFIGIMCSIKIEYEFPIIWELGHLFIANFIGAGVSIAVSLPFKVVQSQLMDVNSLYFNTEAIEQLDKQINPENYEKKKQEKRDAMKFDGLNETQLYAELSAALKEERFEDAEKIRKILETKFR